LILPAHIGSIAARRTSSGSGGGGGAETDPNFSSLISGLHCDGADGSTTFTDIIGKTWTAQGNAQIDTAQSKFGGASLLLDGTGDYATTPDHADWDFGSGDFLWRGWYRANSIAAAVSLISKRANAAAFAPFNFYINITTGRLGILMSTSGSAWDLNILQSSGGISTGTWYDIAVSKVGTGVKGFIDGVEVVNGTLSGTLMTNATAVSLGAGGADGVASANGWLDDVQCYKGYGISAGYTPRTTAFPDS